MRRSRNLFFSRVCAAAKICFHIAHYYFRPVRCSFCAQSLKYDMIGIVFFEIPQVIILQNCNIKKRGITVANERENNKVVKNEININGKKIHAFLLMVFLIIPIFITLYCIGEYNSKTSESMQENMANEVLGNIVSHMDTMSITAMNQFESNLSARVALNVSFLQEDVENGEYVGDRVLTEGFVVKLDGDKVILPEGAPQGGMNISRSMIEKGIDSGKPRTGRLVIANPSDEADSSLSVSDYSSSGMYKLTFAKITDTDIYVHITSEDRYTEYIQLYTADTLEALKNFAEITNGMIVLVALTDTDVEVLDSYGKIGNLKEFPVSAVTPDLLNAKEPTEIELNGMTCRCVSVEADAQSIDAQQLFFLQIFPQSSASSQNLMQALLICMLMILILITLITYILAEQKYVVENALTNDEAARYNPTKLRRKIVYAGLVGAIAIFFTAFLTQAVGQLHEHIRYGDTTLQLVVGSIQKSLKEQRKSIKAHQEDWYVRTGENIADFLSDNPELATQEKLAEYANILSADYLMVFDSKGKEYVSSNGFDGFTLSSGLGVDSSDFRSLLLGIPSIVHQPSVDSVTNLERQMIGVTMTAVDDPEKHGALIIALLPDQTDVAQVIADIGEELALTMNTDNMVFDVLESTGVILDSTRPAMEGLTIEECGLSSSSLQDGYMDFDRINEEPLFILTKKSGEHIIYYATEYRNMVGQNLLFSITGVALFIFLLVLIVRALMKNYTDASYKKWVTARLPNIPARWRKLTSKGAEDENGIVRGADDAKFGSTMQAGKEYLDRTIELNRNKAIEVINKFFDWDQRLPERKASLVFYVGLFLMVLFWCILLLSNQENVSLLYYLMYGDWNRGLNTFSIYCILLSCGAANLFVTVTTWILFLIGGFLSSKGETICRLLRSIIRYITIIAMIFISLSYLGVLNSTVIASMGLGSVVLSLGAKDIVADILSGILIVFEQTLRIGDIVQYDGKMGIVREVGMRTTKLELIPANDILEVRNHEIATVINMSKYASTCLMDFRIRATESLEKVEGLLNSELPRIGKGCDDMVGTPVYLGVSQLGSQGGVTIPLLTLTIAFNCDQKNYYTVYYYLNRELHNLMENNDISVL